MTEEEMTFKEQTDNSLRMLKAAKNLTSDAIQDMLSFKKNVEKT